MFHIKLLDMFEVVGCRQDMVNFEILIRRLFECFLKYYIFYIHVLRTSATKTAWSKFNYVQIPLNLQFLNNSQESIFSQKDNKTVEDKFLKCFSKIASTQWIILVTSRGSNNLHTFIIVSQLNRLFWDRSLCNPFIHKPQA